MLFDVPESDLLQHWEDTYKFILNAAKSNGKVLIHCKMGISRSASTVCAFLMKYKSWGLKHALRFVKGMTQYDRNRAYSLDVYIGLAAGETDILTPIDIVLKSFRINLIDFNDYFAESQKYSETFFLEIFSRLVNMIIEPFYIDPEGFTLGVEMGQHIRFTENKTYLHLKNIPEQYPN